METVMYAVRHANGDSPGLQAAWVFATADPARGSERRRAGRPRGAFPRLVAAIGSRVFTTGLPPCV